jgi:hypothetical protein
MFDWDFSAMKENLEPVFEEVIAVVIIKGPPILIMRK